jgi:hypothetical protein
VTDFQSKLSDFCDWVDASSIRDFKIELAQVLNAVGDRIVTEVPVQTNGEALGKSEAIEKLRQIAKEIHDDESP